MTDEKRQGIVFQVETTRILEILAKEIYDSPHALLRENVQNAYDAVLMRFSDDFTLADAAIDLTVEPNQLTIRDNGIGMDEVTLRNNFWKAGSSGKRTEEARKAGVVGTFGIGAMANFGVAEEIVVESRPPGQSVVLRTAAKRSELSIQEECITLEEVEVPDFAPGTLVRVRLDEENRLNTAAAREYLASYVRFLPVAVRCNGELISQEDWGEVEGAADAVPVPIDKLVADLFTADVEVLALNEGARILVRLEDLDYQGVIGGRGVFVQGKPSLLGLRNHFGLATVPASGDYSFGGYLNAAFLHPTAGREALSRESIQVVNRLVSEVEGHVSEALADTDLADRNGAFLQRARRGPAEWARNVAVRLAPFEGRVRLRDLKTRDLLYFKGSDAKTINTYSSEASPLVVLDASNPRRNLQQRYVTSILGLQEVPDQPQVIKIFDGPELSYAEASFMVRASSILMEEHLISDVQLALAEISHGVQVLVDTPGDPAVRVLLSRNHPHLGAVLEAHSVASDVFTGFVRDFIRTNVYGSVSQFVPSATRQGAEALIAQIERTRELFRYDEEEFGFEPLLSDLLSGEVSVGEVIRRAGRRPRSHSQQVTAGQVGSVEEELPDVAQNLIPGDQSLDAAPPIMRPNLETSMKILKASADHPALNGYRTMLGLSDRASRRERPFFEAPHQTRVMWAQHRIVYVFTHASGELSLYYDIEMPEPLEGEAQGGTQLPTTTLVTKGRIFVPVPPEIQSAFELVDGKRRFHVRFDTVTS